MPKTKTSISAENFIQFYNSLVKRIQNDLRKTNIEVSNDSVWQQVKGRDPYFVIFLCQDIKMPIGSSDIREAFCDSKGAYVNLNYMYSLKNDAIAGKNNLKLFTSRGNLFARYLGFEDLANFIEQCRKDSKGGIKIYEENDAEEIIKQFYTSIAEKEFEKAWCCLSDDFKGRIWSKHDVKGETIEKRDEKRLSYFISGYHFFRAIYNLHVFLPKKTGEVGMEFMVYYESEMDLPVINELISLNNTSIVNIESFVKDLKKLSELIVQLGGKPFDNRQISRLFHPAVFEFVWWISEIEPWKLRQQFDIKTTDPPIRMLFNCKCKKENGTWKINAIIPCRY